jgi:hypothetical protein
VCTTRRGIIDEGEVRPEDFVQGQADIDNLVQRGAVWDRSPKKSTGTKDDGPAAA